MSPSPTKSLYSLPPPPLLYCFLLCPYHVAYLFPKRCGMFVCSGRLSVMITLWQVFSQLYASHLIFLYFPICQIEIMILNQLVEVVRVSIRWYFVHSLNMKYVSVVHLFSHWLLEVIWNKHTSIPSLPSALSIPHQSMSFLSAAPSILYVLCSILTIALSFPVCGKCYFTWARWCNERVSASLSGDLTWVLVLSITAWVWARSLTALDWFHDL